MLLLSVLPTYNYLSYSRTYYVITDKRVIF